MNKVCQVSISIILSIAITLTIASLIMGVVGKIQKIVEQRHTTQPNVYTDPHDAE
jgi:hypothetical protein